MAKETTLKKEIVFSGTGLHTGKPIEMIMWPAKKRSGVVFLYGRKRVKAGLGTCGGGLFSVHAGPVITIEHLLAAIFAMELDNVKIELSAEEVPIMDGSALPFAAAIKKAGLVFQPAKRREIFLKEPVVAGEQGRMIIASPSEKLSIMCGIDFDHPLIGRQLVKTNITPSKFLRELAPARTFGWEKQVKLQRKKGLIKGAGIHNAVYFGDTKVKNPEGLRFPDEPVRHKAVDILGVLALLPGRLNAKITAYRSGHSLDLELIQKIGGKS